MYEHDLKELIKIVSAMDKKEWNNFKSYVDHKFKIIGCIKDDNLTYDTLKTFFIKVKKLN